MVFFIIFHLCRYCVEITSLSELFFSRYQATCQLSVLPSIEILSMLGNVYVSAISSSLRLLR